jgi:hypothetical protein
MLILTLLDTALTISIFTLQMGWGTTKFIYGLYKGRQKSDYDRFIEYMEERDRRIFIIDNEDFDLLDEMEEDIT